MHGVNLVYLPGRRQTKNLVVQEANHVLTVDAFSRLPANVQDAAELDIAERADSVSRRSVESLCSNS
jgi:hypothetical protein